MYIPLSEYTTAIADMVPNVDAGDGSLDLYKLLSSKGTGAKWPRKSGSLSEELRLICSERPSKKMVGKNPCQLPVVDIV